MTIADTETSNSRIGIFCSAISAARLGIRERLQQAIEQDEYIGDSRCVDKEGRTLLHIASGYGHDTCVELLLAQRGCSPAAQDVNGDTALHLACASAAPHPSYLLAQADAKCCQIKNKSGKTPICIAVACERGECLNAMLLACAGQSCDAAFTVMSQLLKHGAVPDTWAPNGCSALMLAATAGRADAISLLHQHGATLELQDALGRTALMFAAGNSCSASLQALLDLGASLAVRDRKGRSALDYAASESDAHAKLLARLAVLEAEAAVHQAALLELLESGEAGTKGTRKGPAASSKRKKKKDRGLKQNSTPCGSGSNMDGVDGGAQESTRDVQCSRAVAAIDNAADCSTDSSNTSTNHMTGGKVGTHQHIEETRAAEDDSCLPSCSDSCAQGMPNAEDADWQLVSKGGKRPAAKAVTGARCVAGASRPATGMQGTCTAAAVVVLRHRPQCGKQQTSCAVREQGTMQVPSFQSPGVAACGQQPVTSRSCSRNSSSSCSTNDNVGGSGFLGPCSWAQRVRGTSADMAVGAERRSMQPGPSDDGSRASSRTSAGNSDASCTSTPTCQGPGPAAALGLVTGNSAPTFADVAALRAPLLCAHVNSPVLGPPRARTDGYAQLCGTTSGDSSSDGFQTLGTFSGDSGESVLAGTNSGSVVVSVRMPQPDGLLQQTSAALDSGSQLSCSMPVDLDKLLPEGLLGIVDGPCSGEVKGPVAQQSAPAVLRPQLLHQATVREALLEQQVAALQEHVASLQQELAAATARWQWAERDRKAEMVAVLQEAAKREAQVLEEAVLRERAVLALELGADLQAKGLLPPNFLQSAPLPPALADITATLAAHMSGRPYGTGRVADVTRRPVYMKNGTRRYGQSLAWVSAAVPGLHVPPATAKVTAAASSGDAALLATCCGVHSPGEQHRICESGSTDGNVLQSVPGGSNSSRSCASSAAAQATQCVVHPLEAMLPSSICD